MAASQPAPQRLAPHNAGLDDDQRHRYGFGGHTGNVGVLNTSPSSPTITHSRLSGSTYSMRHDGGTAKVALTQLVGPIHKSSNSTLQCFDNYDENMAAKTC